MTKLTGLIGDPVSHSRSPHIHAYWGEQYHIQLEYKLLTTSAKRLRQTMFHMRRKRAVGLNVTIPHKQEVIQYLDGLDATAKRIGAVNTIMNTDGVFTGHNTDAYGFITNLRVALTRDEKGDITNYLEHAVLLGAGGATRAAIVALQDAGVKKITLTNRTMKNALALANEFQIEATEWESRAEVLKTASLLVNTTSLGMHGKPKLELDVSVLPEGCAVYDIVYAPHETQLLVDAKARNLPIIHGIGMLIYQAQAAFYTWHGIHPEVTEELKKLVLEPAA